MSCTDGGVDSEVWMESEEEVNPLRTKGIRLRVACRSGRGTALEIAAGTGNIEMSRQLEQ